MSRLLLVCLLVASAILGAAEQDRRQFDTAAQRQLYLQLTAELRCPQCQNQNIADSNAVVAVDMRDKTHELVLQGKDRQQILDYMINRYGYFVHYQPPVNRYTLLLWLAPAVLLVGLLLVGVYRRQQGKAQTQMQAQMQQPNADELDLLIKRYRSKK